jgi:acetyl esterase/lipase
VEDQAPVEALFTGGLTYEVDGTRRLLLDVLRPATGSPSRPAVLFVHGGGWHEGDRGAGMHPWLNPLLVSQGFVTASMTYRLSGEAHWPVPLHDVHAAVRWLRTHAGEYGADPDRIGIWGHSAGAHLAAMAALTATGQEQVQAVALRACPADLRDEHLDSGNEVARLMGPDASLDTLTAASPICNVHPAAPPFLLAHGTHDEIVPIAQSLAFRDALVSSGVKVHWAPINDAPHEWADLPGHAPDTEVSDTFGALTLNFFCEQL